MNNGGHRAMHRQVSEIQPQTSYNKPSLIWSIIGFPSVSTIFTNIALLYCGVSYLTSPDDCRFNLIPLYLIISNSLLLATSLFRILCLHQALRTLRDGDLIGLFVGVANLAIVCWGTSVLFGYGQFNKWDLDKENPSYCEHAPVILALANLIATWVLVPLFMSVELYKICKACSLRIKNPGGDHDKKKTIRAQGFHNASLKINGIV